jgi:hypothetical protein
VAAPTLRALAVRLDPDAPRLPSAGCLAEAGVGSLIIHPQFIAIVANDLHVH